MLKFRKWSRLAGRSRTLCQRMILLVGRIFRNIPRHPDDTALQINHNRLGSIEAHSDHNGLYRTTLVMARANLMSNVRGLRVYSIPLRSLIRILLVLLSDVAEVRALKPLWYCRAPGHLFSFCLSSNSSVILHSDLSNFLFYVYRLLERRALSKLYINCT